MRRMIPPGSVLAVLALVLCSIGCDVQQAWQEVAPRAAIPAGEAACPSGGHVPCPSDGMPRPTPVAADGNTIRIASFNIQVFGTSKLDKPETMGVLAEVVRQFDVVAIQEVRSKDQSVVPRFVELINAAGARYGHVIGPRLGRTSSKEQYAFVYDTSRLELQPGSVYTVPDPEDFLHREPLVARFRVRGPPTGEAFTFSLINIHTDPDETDTELDALDDVFLAVQRDGSGEDDVILLGDLNVDDNHLGQLGRLPGIAWVISGRPTNTRGTKSYDNLLFDRRATVEFTGYGGVLDLMAEFGLSMEQALKVSDHLPIWAEFSVLEARAGTPIATRPGKEPL